MMCIAIERSSRANPTNWRTQTELAAMLSVRLQFLMSDDKRKSSVHDAVLMILFLVCSNNKKFWEELIAYFP
jgi:hypothetical protein